MAELPEAREKARRLGARYARNAMLFGLLCACWIFILVTDLKGLARIIEDSPAQAIICVALGPWVAHHMGAWAGPLVLLRGRNAFLISLLVGVCSVGITTFAFSLVSFFQEGWPGDGTFTEAVWDYIGKPLYWVFFMGSLPMVLAGAGMAVAFRRARRKVFGPA